MTLWVEYLLKIFKSEESDQTIIIENDEKSILIDLIKKIFLTFKNSDLEENCGPLLHLEYTLATIYGFISDINVEEINKKEEKFKKMNLTEKKISIYTKEEKVYSEDFEVEYEWDQLLSSSKQNCLLIIEKIKDSFPEAEFLKWKLKNKLFINIKPWENENPKSSQVYFPGDDELIRKNMLKCIFTLIELPLRLTARVFKYLIFFKEMK